MGDKINEDHQKSTEELSIVTEELKVENEKYSQLECFRKSLDNWVKINKSIAKGQQYKPLQLIEEKPEKIIEPVATIATKKIPQCCKCKSISDQAYMEHCYQCNKYFHYACCEPVILLTHKSSIYSKNYLWQCADCEDDNDEK